MRIFHKLVPTVVALALLMGTPSLRAAELAPAEAQQIAVEAYIYGYSLVSMDVTRRLMTNVPPGVKVGLGPANAFQPWLIALFGAFVAPFTEEAVFRGLLYPSLRKVLPGGAFGAAVAVSLLFAAIHGSLVAFVPLFVLAMLLAGVMERTNSLLACVVVHAIHNGTSLVPMMVRVVSGGGS